MFGAIKGFLVISILCIIVLFCSCTNTESDTYDVNGFKADLNICGYNSATKIVPGDVFSAKKTTISAGDEIITVYSYDTKSLMEQVANEIDTDGSGLCSSVRITWVSLPHFYKKGKIMVLYVGDNDKTISDLNNLFSYQFAGL